MYSNRGHDRSGGRCRLDDVLFVIPFRNAGLHRLRNLHALLSWLDTHFPQVEVMIVEQDERENTPISGHPRLSHMFLHNGGAFNKSWAINCSLVAAQAPLFVVGDADLIMSPEGFLGALQGLSWAEAIDPFASTGIRYLSDGETERLALTGRWDELRGEPARPGYEPPFAGGLVMFRREALQRVGGFPEEFVGWGGEDDAMSLKVERMMTSDSYQALAFHMYHPRPGSEQHPDYRANVRRVQQLEAMSRPAFESYCHQAAMSMGDPHTVPSPDD